MTAPNAAVLMPAKTLLVIYDQNGTLLLLLHQGGPNA
jgi:hypothetical protein